MRVTSNADWRRALAFDTPVLVADVLPGEPARCSGCGYGSDPLPRTELWAVKRRHPKHHDGDVQFYCVDHLPPVEAPAPAPLEARPAARRAAPRVAAERPPRRHPEPERARAICPDCFVEVPTTGVCGICGQTVAPAC